MEELKPCPFCGGENAFYDTYEHHKGAYRVRVVCPDCMGQVDAGYWQDKSGPTDAWNRRADECDRDELLKVADELYLIAENASTDSIGPFLQVSTIRPSTVKAYAERVRKALEGGGE